MNKKQKAAKKKFEETFLVFQKQMKEQGIEISMEEFIKQADSIIDRNLDKDEYSVDNAISDVNDLIKNVTITDKKLKEHIKKWTEENKPLGEMLGYPNCCIKEFCNQPPIVLESSIMPTKEDLMRYDSGCIDGNFTGFIPCAFHAKEITNGKITLYSLIQNRDSNLPNFPFL